MGVRKDLTGMKYNRWTVIERAENAPDGKSRWLCRCDCGTEKVISQQSLVMNKTISCGCYRKEWASTHGVTHGMKKTRLYRIYQGMKGRVTSPSNKYWDKYGGRGISLCDEWKKGFEPFRDWALANGYTDELTLDRIDNDGNYEPSNCRWVSYKVQENNRRNTVYCIYEGERVPVMYLAERLGMSRDYCKKHYGEKKYG